MRYSSHDNSGGPVKSIALIILIILLILLSTCLTAAAQKEETPQAPTLSAADLAAKIPAPKPDDVKSIDAILRAAYDSISGPAGTRDWDRFRSLFLPQARFTQVGKGPDGSNFVI